MFYSVKGVLREIVLPNKAVVQLSEFISLEIFIPFRLIDILKNDFLGKEVVFYVVCFIRKNEFLELYGFLERESRELFIKLNQLSKIGPKLALNILSTFTPEALRQIVTEKKVKKLAKVPGIGPKRAEKLFLELKNLFFKPTLKGMTLPLEKEILLEEAKACLISLGFSGKEAEKILYKVFEEKDTLDVLIKKALKELAPKVQEETFK